MLLESEKEETAATAIGTAAQDINPIGEKASGNTDRAAGLKGDLVDPLFTESSTKRFLVALSFAGEDRQFVSQVASRLAAAIGRERVLYDRFYEAELARPNLDTYLQNLYYNESELVVVFLGSDYERKEWPGLEWRALRDLLKKRKDSSVMFVRLDGGDVTGSFSIDGYVPVAGRSPKRIAELILKRLQLPVPGRETAPSVKPPSAVRAPMFVSLRLWCGKHWLWTAVIAVGLLVLIYAGIGIVRNHGRGASSPAAERTPLPTGDKPAADSAATAPLTPAGNPPPKATSATTEQNSIALTLEGAHLPRATVGVAYSFKPLPSRCSGNAALEFRKRCRAGPAARSAHRSAVGHAARVG